MDKLAVLVIAGLVMLSVGAPSCSQQSESLVITDYALFRHTPLWNFTIATKDGDSAKMRDIQTKEKVDINLQEPKFGATLLMVTILNRQLNSSSNLLSMGADPDLNTTIDGTCALIFAAGIEGYSKDDTEFINVLLKFGADPNNSETAGPDNSNPDVPLWAACRSIKTSPLEKVKLLVNAGANVNFRNSFGNNALREALTFDHLDVVEFLLQHGVDYESSISSKADVLDLHLWDELRFHLYPLNSEKYRQKMKIVDFLLRNGIDYRQSVIPEYAIKGAKKLYPNDWEEYLKLY
jgi:uncharacterized protein